MSWMRMNGSECQAQKNGNSGKSDHGVDGKLEGMTV